MAWRGVWDEGPWADLHDLVLGDGLIVGWGEGEAAVGSCVVGEELQWNVLLPLAALAEVQAVHAHEPIRAGDDAYHEGQLESGGVGRAGGGVRRKSESERDVIPFDRLLRTINDLKDYLSLCVSGSAGQRSLSNSGDKIHRGIRVSLQHWIRV